MFKNTLFSSNSVTYIFAYRDKTLSLLKILSDDILATSILSYLSTKELFFIRGANQAFLDKFIPANIKTLEVGFLDEDINMIPQQRIQMYFQSLLDYTSTQGCQIRHLRFQNITLALDLNLKSFLFEPLTEFQSVNVSKISFSYVSAESHHDANSLAEGISKLSQIKHLEVDNCGDEFTDLFFQAIYLQRKDVRWISHLQRVHLRDVVMSFTNTQAD